MNRSNLEKNISVDRAYPLVSYWQRAGHTASRTLLEWQSRASAMASPFELFQPSKGCG